MRTHESEVKKGRNFVNQILKFLKSTDHPEEETHRRGPNVKTRHNPQKSQTKETLIC